MVVISARFSDIQDGLFGGNRVYYTLKVDGSIKDVAWHDGFAWIVFSPTDLVTEADFVTWAIDFVHTRSAGTVNPTRVMSIKAT